MNAVGSVFVFNADVTCLRSNCVESSSIILNNIKWSVELCRSNNNPNVIDVTLKSAMDGYVPRWNCNAQASVKLLPKTELRAMIEKQLPQQKFTEINASHGIVAFINLDVFFTYYVSDNRATFEIALSTNSMNIEDVADMNQIKSRVHVMLPNVSRLGRATSPVVVVQGIKWQVVVERQHENLSIYLEATESDFNRGSTYRVDANFKLLTYDPSARPVIKSFTQTYHWGATLKGFTQFISWIDFIDGSRKFILDDKANLLVEFQVEPESLWQIDDSPIIA